MDKKTAITASVVFAIILSTHVHSSEKAYTGSLVSAYKQAQNVDPEFRTALAEYDANVIDSRISGSAYYPQLLINSSQLENEAGDQRTTASIIQPILSADRFATIKEKRPRAQIAELTLEVKRNELALRLYKIFTELTIAREGLIQNQGRLDALKHQYDAGKRAYELGQGTLTDMADAKVMVLQAQAEDLKLHNDLKAAEDEYQSIVGQSPPYFALNNSIQNIDFDENISSENYVDQNLQVKLTQLNSRLGELEVTRAKSAWIPELNASYTYTDLDGENEEFFGLSLSFPIQANHFFGISKADAQRVKLREEELDVRRSTKLDIDRLSSTLVTGMIELQTRKNAIAAAELSVKSNQKSYEGGVKSLLDVLHSIEVLHSVRNNYVQSTLSLGDSLLNLRIAQGYLALSGLAEVETLLLTADINSSFKLYPKSKYFNLTN